jgi:hypothetical protein
MVLKILNNNCKLEERAGGGVEVNLSIPVQNGTLAFRKLYQPGCILVKMRIHIRINFHL